MYTLKTDAHKLYRTRRYIRWNRDEIAAAHDVENKVSDENSDPKPVKWKMSQIRDFKSQRQLNDKIKNKQLAQHLRKHNFLGVFERLSQSRIESLLINMRMNRTEDEFEISIPKESSDCGTACDAVPRFHAEGKTGRIHVLR